MPDDLIFVWNLFCRANSGRQASGFGVCGLAISDIAALLDLHKVRGEEREDIFLLISGMDAEYVKEENREAAVKAQERNKGKARAR